MVWFTMSALVTVGRLETASPESSAAAMAPVGMARATVITPSVAMVFMRSFLHSAKGAKP
jgi:hypothetical protein